MKNIMPLSSRNLTIAVALFALLAAANALTANATAEVVWNNAALEEARRDRMGLTAEQLRAASRKSSDVLQSLGHKAQWLPSHAAGEKIFCVYSAPSEALIPRHAAKSRLPANRITPVSAVIDRSTGALTMLTYDFALSRFGRSWRVSNHGNALNAAESRLAVDCVARGQGQPTMTALFSPFPGGCVIDRACYARVR